MFLSWYSAFEKALIGTDNHDASFIFSDLLGTPNQNLKSQILFFCITCFDHPALITCSIRLERFWNDFHPHPSPESESQIKTSNTRKRIYKGPLDDQSPPWYLEKMSPLRGNMFSSSIAPSSSSLRTFSLYFIMRWYWMLAVCHSSLSRQLDFTFFGYGPMAIWPYGHIWPFLAIYGLMAIGPYAINMGKWGIPGKIYKNVAQQC